MSDAAILAEFAARQAAADRPQHRRILNTTTGHTLRLTRWAPGTIRRDVYLVTPSGALVELGHVVTLGGRSCMAYPAIPGARGYGCDTFEGGARLLDDRIAVQPVTTYTLSLRPEHGSPSSDG